MDNTKVAGAISDIEKILFGLKQEIGLNKELKKQNPEPRTHKSNNVNFNLNYRAFMNQYSRGMNGQKKFTLLVAYLVKGETEKEVQLSEVEKAWNTMAAIMGGKFNYKYPTVAKTFGWVDSKKKSLYLLDQTWREIFN